MPIAQARTPAYAAWDFVSVEDRLLEAAVLSRQIHSGLVAPQCRLTYWPEYVGLYAPSKKETRHIAPDQMSRLEECQDWLNRYLGEEERKLIRGWLICKTTYRKNRMKSGKTLQNMAANMEINSKTLRRTVIRLCQRIAERLNEGHKPLNILDACAQSDIRAEAAAYRVAPARPGRTPRSTRDISEPLVNDVSPEGVARIKKAIERANKRNRRAKKARQKHRAKPAKKQPKGKKSGRPRK